MRTTSRQILDYDRSITPPRLAGPSFAETIMAKQDDYLQSQLPQVLQPGERVLHVAYMLRQPGLLMQILLVGGLLLFLITKAYFVVLTDRRLILIRTKMGFWTGGPQCLNLGVEEYDVRQLQKVTVSGFLNNRSMTFHLANAQAQTLRISPMVERLIGTKSFFQEVPRLVESGQLAQLAAGAAQGGYAAMPQQAGGYGAPPQQQQPQAQAQAQFAPQQQAGGYGAPPQQQAQAQFAPQQQGFAPGARVQVVGQDGNRYPATFVQAQNGQCLCAMPDGQQHWIPSSNVSPG
jgi:hypothetical protein